MSRNRGTYAIAFLVFGISAVSHAQPSDAWMMQNYHRAAPPPPVKVVPADPVIAELRQIQTTVLSIMRKANFAEDYEAALAAAAQAAANAQLMGAIAARMEPPPAPPKPVTILAPEEPEFNTAIYTIALKDHAIHFASSYWTDKWMLHYLTRQGTHVQIRLDLVDLDLTTRLNREKNLDFRLSQ
jgi:hypothetical protein